MAAHGVPPTVWLDTNSEVSHAQVHMFLKADQNND